MERKDNDLLVLNNQELTNPINYVKQDIRSYWDRDYINEKIDLIKNTKHRFLIQVLWMTGLRVSEITNIRKRDIDIDSYLMRVRWLKSRKYNERVVPIHPMLRDLLQLFVAPLKADDKLFSYSRQRVYQLTIKYLGGKTHMLRHSFAVNWLKCGGDIVILSRVMGHSSINTTMEYLKIVPIDQGKELMKVRFR
jgi:integrase